MSNSTRLSVHSPANGNINSNANWFSNLKKKWSAWKKRRSAKITINKSDSAPLLQDFAGLTLSAPEPAAVTDTYGTSTPNGSYTGERNRLEMAYSSGNGRVHSSPYPPNAQLVDCYILQQTIGSGSFSQVKLAKHSVTGATVAIKMIDRKALSECARLRMTAMREIELLKTIDHPNIVKYVEVVETETHLCILLEWVPGGELFQLVTERGRLTEEETRTIFKQLIDAVDYLHRRGIVHRDLKLENIIVASLTPLTVKIIDFGLARSFKANQLLSTRCGSEEYAAPEVIIGEAYDGRKSDIWSLGIILYACLFGSLPFNPEPARPKALYDKICKTNYRIPPGITSLAAQSLIRNILIANPRIRTSIDEVKVHPWFHDPVTFSGVYQPRSRSQSKSQDNENENEQLLINFSNS